LWKNVSNMKKVEITGLATFLLILLSISIPCVDAASSPTITIEPPSITVGDEGIPTDPFIITINITNVEAMFSWQVKIYYDTTILNCTTGGFPTGHVFEGKLYFPAGPVIEEDYVLVGASLVSEDDVFTGNGTLCQITFVGKAAGTSNLEFDVDESYCTDYDLNKISVTTENGNVIVIPEFTLSLMVSLFILTTLVAILFKTTWFKKRLNTRAIQK